MYMLDPVRLNAWSVPPPAWSAKLKLLDTTQEARVNQGLLLDILSEGMDQGSLTTT